MPKPLSDEQRRQFITAIEQTLEAAHSEMTRTKGQRFAYFVEGPGWAGNQLADLREWLKAGGQ